MIQSLLTMKYFDFVFYILLTYLLYLKILPNVHHPLSYNDPLWHRNVFSPFENIDTSKKIKKVDFWRNFYHYKDNLFFYDDMGEITHRVRFDKNNRVSVSRKNYIIFDHNIRKTTLFKMNGYALWSLNTAFYPLLSPSGNNIVFVSPNGMAFNIYSVDRNEILPLTYLDSMITDLDFCRFNDNLGVSLAGGKVIVFDQAGQKLFDRQFSSSKINYIKTINSSEDGLYYAILAGLYPEYLILLKNNGEELWRQKTIIERRQHVSILVNSLNNQILEPGQGRVYFRSLHDGRILYVLDLKDLHIFEIRYIIADFAKEMTIVGINGYSNNCVLLLDKKGKIFWKQKYRDNHLLYVGFSNDEDDFIIHTSQNIFAYHINGLK